MARDVYVLGGYQTDFGRNWTKENKHFSALMREAVLGALEREWYIVAFLILLSSLLAVVYVWRVVEVMYFQEEGSDSPRADPPASMWIPTWVLIGATVFFGFNTSLTASVARDAAAMLLGGPQ